MATLTVFASADAFVDSASPASNFGTQTNMGWWHDGSTERNLAFVKFSMASVPTTITAATLNIYKNGGPGDVGTHNIDRVTGADWTEGGLTYSNKPATTAYTTMANIATTTGAFAPVDVKTLVENWKSGTWSNFGLAIRKGSLFGSFDARTRESANVPFLTITYNSAPTTPGAFTTPAAGVTYDASIAAAWGASTDAEGDAITYSLYYSIGGGAQVLIASGIVGAAYTWNCSAAAASTTYKLHVYAVAAGQTSAVRDSSTFTIAHNATPTAPTVTSLMGATNGGTTDLAAGGTLVGVFADPDVGDHPSAIYIRRKVVGAPSYEWYNGGTGAWQGTAVKIIQTASSFTFPAAKWSNGSTYNVSIAFEDAQGAMSPYSSDITVAGSNPAIVTVTSPSGTVTTTSRPVVVWSVSDPDGDPKQRYDVRLERGAYGTTPGAGTSVTGWQSGDVASSTTLDYQGTTDLTNGTTYRVFVRVKTNDQWSAWSYSTFTLALTPPAAPTLVVTDDPANGRVLLEVSGNHSAVTFPVVRYQIERSLDDAGDAWEVVRGADALVPDGSLDASTYDLEPMPNALRLYRATAIAVVA